MGYEDTIRERRVFWPIHICEPDYSRTPQRMNRPRARKNSRVRLPGPPQHVLVDARQRELARRPLLGLLVLLVLRRVLPR